MVAKASSGTPRSSFLAPGKADDGVAALDVVVEKVERLAGIVGLQPEGDLAEFDRQRVQVHAVDAVADHVAHGGTEGGGRGLFLAGADDGQFGGDAPGRGQQDMAGAAGDVGDAQGEQRLLGFGLLELVGDQVVERMLDERLDQIVRRVVGAGGGALIALGEGRTRRGSPVGDERPARIPASPS